MRTADEYAVRFALQHGLLGPPQLAEALARYERGSVTPGARRRLGDFLVQEGLVDGRRLARLFADELRLPLVDLSAVDVPPEAPALFPRAALEQSGAFPFARGPGTVRLAVSDPFDFESLDRLARSVGLAIELAVAPADEIEQAIRRHCRPDPGQVARGLGR